MRKGEVIAERYELLRFAGAGGMGRVYEVVDRHTRQRVAVKVLSGIQRDDLSRFAREARISTELEHPHIVRAVAHGALHTGEPYLVMEWLEGESLSARLSRGPLTVEECITLGVRVGEALGFAHARGIVHRDIKPANLFLPGGRIEDAKVLDFGIAHVIAETRVTRSGTLLGTPGYMAPEQARGDIWIDARADVFSMGSVLFECLTGEQAFAGVHAMAILAKILLAEPPRLREKRPELPDELDALLARMLSKEPAERPQDGGEVAAALRELREAPRWAAETMVPPNGQRNVLTDGERLPVAVILLGAPRLADVHEAGDTDAEADGSALRAEAARYGGHFERLMDGSVAVTLTRKAMATDLAGQAAQCALSLRARTDRPIALTMGRCEQTRRPIIGPAIDRAAALVEGTACIGGGEERAPIVLDDVTVGLLDARFDVRIGEAGPMLHGEHARGDGMRTTLLGKPTPCVGRDRELRLLTGSFDECVEERSARAVLVTAPAGVGKSRLGQELLRNIRARDAAAVWTGRGEPLRVGSAFGMLGQVIRSACAIRDGEPVEVRRDKLSARVALRIAGSKGQRVAEFLGEIIGTPFPDEGSMPLRAARRDAQLMSDQMLAAFLELVRAECDERPVVLLLEDLHWGDQPTVNFIDCALREHEGMPLFVLALARPEVHDLFRGLWRKRPVHEIGLHQLTSRAVELLARHVLGDRAGHDTVERLVRLSGGNAFYLEELIRATAEGKTEDLPETVVAMVQSRLGAFDEGQRRLLRAASIFGEVFWVGGVVALIGDARGTQAQRLLEGLVECEIISLRRESRFPGEDEYAFRHALVREGAYAMLTDADRTLGHRLAGEWLEKHGEQDALVLAEHFERGEETARAAVFFLRAAELAMRGGDSNAVIERARRGLACDVPKDLRIALLGLVCEAAGWHQQAAKDALQSAEELMRLAPQGSLPWLQGAFASIAAATMTNTVEEQAATFEALHATAPSADGVGLLVFTCGAGAFVLDLLGRIQEANDLMVYASTVLRGLETDDPIAVAWYHAFLGVRGAYAHEDPWRALECSRESVRVLETIHHRRGCTGAGVMQGTNAWYLGAALEVDRTLRETAVPDDELGAAAASYRLFALAWSYADRESLDEARQFAADMTEFGRSRDLPLHEGRGRWVLAEVCRRMGDFEAADREIRAALPLLAVASPLDRPGVLATLAALRLAQGRPEEALGATEEGLARREAMGACGFFRDAFLRLVHAKCLKASGHHEAARAAIDAARARILTNADKIGDPALRESFLGNVPENRETLALARAWGGEDAASFEGAGARPSLEQCPP
ncbi:serine/threonine-protein kinase [Polyangium aurulentum]|uniref:serine/threonine-protein kinase n=1 Tax=Polyangium aurulentum TaxID=2567896 RepID=UPI00146DFB21|nr:serine/threonine-protein kinase [Polyangium aurulentum]UQA54721.1 protein kinase [Polyangium aurulentum]